MANLVSSLLPPTVLFQRVYFETHPGRPLISFVNISARIHNYFALVEAYSLPASETCLNSTLVATNKNVGYRLAYFNKNLPRGHITGAYFPNGDTKARKARVLAKVPTPPGPPGPRPRSRLGEEGPRDRRRGLPAGCPSRVPRLRTAARRRCRSGPRGGGSIPGSPNLPFPLGAHLLHRREVRGDTCAGRAELTARRPRFWGRGLQGAGLAQSGLWGRSRRRDVRGGAWGGA